MNVLAPQVTTTTPTGGKKNPLGSRKVQEGPWNEPLFHQACGAGVDQLLIKAMKAQSLDNLSVVMIGLKGFYQSMNKAWDAKNASNNTTSPQATPNP